MLLFLTELIAEPAEKFIQDQQNMYRYGGDHKLFDCSNQKTPYIRLILLCSYAVVWDVALRKD